MAIHIARGLLKRYPKLRSAWPVAQASAWRRRQDLRAQPRRMASWYRDMADMRTRVFVSNLEVPEAPRLCEPTSVLVKLLDENGDALASKRFGLGRNASVTIELHHLLPGGL